MATKSVTIRVPVELLERLDKEAARKGKSRTDYVLELLEAEGGDLARRLRAMEARIAELEPGHAHIFSPLGWKNDLPQHTTYCFEDMQCYLRHHFKGRHVGLVSDAQLGKGYWRVVEDGSMKALGHVRRL